MKRKETFIFAYGLDIIYFTPGMCKQTEVCLFLFATYTNTANRNLPPLVFTYSTGIVFRDFVSPKIVYIYVLTAKVFTMNKHQQNDSIFKIHRQQSNILDRK